MQYLLALVMVFLGSYTPICQSMELAATSPLQAANQNSVPETSAELLKPPSNAKDVKHLASDLNPIQILQKEYEKYRALADTQQWKTIPRGPLLRFGDTHPHVPMIREKLITLGDLSSANCSSISDPLFDTELHEALERFQKRHGAKVDGIAGPETRRTLNVSLHKRADQLYVNILRLQQFQPNTDRYIQVNVPDFRLHLIEQGRSVLSMKTIVGKKKRKTPIFETEVNRIVINPSWHVPKSIAYRDIVPELEKDPSFLKKARLNLVTGWGNNKRIIAAEDIDYDKLYKGENYQRFWEAPSSSNTLGSVKFLTSGPYSVYLHDTSAKRLFNESKRAFSSGCIRVEQPRQLADQLMRMTQGWNSSKLDPLFEQEKTKHIRLLDPIPLHVTYWTAFIDQDGDLNFRHDLYKRDRYDLTRLEEALLNTDARQN
ncbi:L,D-transpeptidase family protein [Neptuniibacter sp. QD72_48]|uniref:L,D-transpeptidase family protein n=1 Tax=unclassified Neptuniibacter TaxID=2630693 RepID=UPI0039F5FAD6